MAKPTHHIKSQVFDLSVEDAERAPAIQDHIARMAKNGLGDAIEEVLNRHEQPGRRIRIEQLVLDLGEIPEQDLSGELPRRVAQALDEALRKQLAAAEMLPEEEGPEALPGQVRIEPAQQRDIDAVLFFLQTGSLPWWWEAAAAFLPQVTEELLRRDAQGMWSALRKLLSRDEVRDRLRLQFPLSQLHTLLEAAARDAAPHTREFIRKQMAAAPAAGEQLERKLLGEVLQVFSRTDNRNIQPDLDAWARSREKTKPPRQEAGGSAPQPLSASPEAVDPGATRALNSGRLLRLTLFLDQGILPAAADAAALAEQFLDLSPRQAAGLLLQAAAPEAAARRIASQFSARVFAHVAEGLHSGVLEGSSLRKALSAEQPLYPERLLSWVDPALHMQLATELRYLLLAYFASPRQAAEARRLARLVASRLARKDDSQAALQLESRLLEELGIGEPAATAERWDLLLSGPQLAPGQIVQGGDLASEALRKGDDLHNIPVPAGQEAPTQHPGEDRHSPAGSPAAGSSELPPPKSEGALPSVKPGDEPASSLLPQASGESDLPPLEQLKRFIRYGVLSVHAGALDWPALEALLIERLRLRLPELLLWLDQAPIARLIGQFSPAALKEWLAALHPRLAPVTMAFHRLLEVMNRLFSQEIAEPDSRQAIWAPLLSAAVQSAREADDDAAYSRHLLRHLTRQWAQSPATLVEWAAEAARELPEETLAPALALLRQAAGSFPAETPEGRQQPGEPESDEEPPLLRLEQLLKAPEGRQPEGGHAINRLVASLLNAHPEMLLPALQRWSAEEITQDAPLPETNPPARSLPPPYQLAARLAAQLDEPVALALLFALSPSLSGLVRQQAAAIRTLYEQHPGVFSRTGHLSLLQVLGPLAYLLHTPGAPPQATELVRVTVHHLSQITGLPLAEAFSALTRASRATAPDAEGQSAVLTAILEQEAAARQQVPAPESQDLSGAMLSALKAYFREEAGAPGPEEMDRLIRQWAASRPEVARAALWSALAEEDHRLRLSRDLSEKGWQSIAGLFQPAKRDAVAAALAGLSSLISPSFVRSRLLGHLYELNFRPFTLAGFIDDVFASYAGGAQRYDQLLDSSIRFIEAAPPPAAARELLQALRELRREREPEQQQLAAAKPRPPEPGGKSPLPGEIYVGNAGLVLLWPFLTRYFEALEMTAEGAFIDEAAAERAVHLLQFLVNGQSQTPEYELALNKVVCGLPLAQPIAAGIEITEAETAMSEKLLRSVLGNWEKMKDLPVSNLRGAFLLRNGRMEEESATWRLNVEPKPYDMLLDTLPWGLSMVKLPWMKKILHVEWR